MGYTPILMPVRVSGDKFAGNKSTRVALVLSGAGMFGAWQAGAWAGLAGRVKPDLVVGASAGALNGYAIASGIDPDELCRMWLDPQFTRLRDLPANLDRLMRLYQPRTELAITVTDSLRLRARVFRDGEITARHLAASCALPFVMPQVRIDGRWYSDGGLLNPLPVWAAVELGATQIVALHALRDDTFPWWMRALVKSFRAVAGRGSPVSAADPAAPCGVTLQTIRPSRRLGGFAASMRWERERMEQWIALGRADAAAPPAADR
jgi:predicted acylesterase/phospholipase RssA